ncbi:MAG: hypothetical protein OXN17_07950 [Candidatus Poribacteria bacterium]|nr:hypothetical protein [Candidatus Poribacteria bacterium]MDE0506605.1 hypothetical protein [Candidatus Poribacteria bacterium]
MKKRSEKKQESKKKVGRPTKRVVEPIPDTPENVAKALSGMPSDNPKIKKLTRQARN